MPEIGEESHDDLANAISLVATSAQNGSKNGKAVAEGIIVVLTPILLRSADPLIKALGIALGLASRAFLKKKRRRIGKNG